jgi:hypothetical protein
LSCPSCVWALCLVLIRAWRWLMMTLWQFGSQNMFVFAWCAVAQEKRILVGPSCGLFQASVQFYVETTYDWSNCLDDNPA